MLLTRIPMPASAGTADPARAAVCYPVIGALIGAVVGVVARGGLELWPLLVAVTLAVIVEVVLTGALHLDGLADCADSFGGHTRARRLEIMKDHAIGVYGAAAVGLQLLLKVTLVAALAAMLTGPELVLVLAAAYALSRGAMLPLARLLPYARTEGTGRAVVQGLGTQHVAIGLGLTAVLLLPVLSVAAWAGSLTGLSVVVAMLLGAALAATAVGFLAKRSLGGVTGDVLGACAELALLAALLGATAALG